MSDEISDALAASLLKKEATERSLRYSAFGLVAFAGDRKKPHSAPKPNTRFLRNLVKEADSHNTALLAKEAEEARLRLEKLRRDERRSDNRDRSKERHRRRISRSRSPDGRSRRKGRSRSRSRSPERRRRDRDEDGRETKRQRVGVGDIDRLLQASRREKRDGEKDKEKSQNRERPKKDGDRTRSRSRDRKRRDKDRRRSRSREGDRKKRRSGRSRSRDYSRSMSPSSSPDRRRRKSHRRNISRSPSPRKHRKSASPPRAKSARLSPLEDDEDPLAPYLAGVSTRSSPEIGPSFPKQMSKNGARLRGRGLPGSSAMDARFDPSYDPSLDVTPNNPEDEDDWDAALEALRDRQKWKQQGKERLKAAGFDDGFIEAWETNTTKDERRIKWNKDKGGRDWDRGKVVDEETGEVKLKASWAS
ncbi:hypothetical protein TWF694_010557 [Orbilia ellipsospora]|uniref:Pre-mRNA-splicing factor 38B n=1 Tax=Orbilia ellipsospora TaxID=2528407 RepID=A0AAV9XCZ0_9PEZI